MRVFLIRHPRPRIAPGTCYGRLDMDCEAPQEAAEKLKPLLPENAPVFSSPSLRARRLACLLSPEIRIDARLCEIDFGEWEGKPWDTIDRALLEAWARDVFHFTPPGGESVAHMWERAIAFAESLREAREENVILVAHAGVLRALSGYWRRLSREAWMKLDFAWGSLTRIDV